MKQKDYGNYGEVAVVKTPKGKRAVKKLLNSSWDIFWKEVKLLKLMEKEKIIQNLSIVLLRIMIFLLFKKHY